METVRNATLVALILLSSPVVAQTTGDIAGLVVDAQDVPLNGVTIRARNTETGVGRDTRSDRGVYRLAGLPIGTYDVVAELQGMRPFTAPRVVVNLGNVANLDIRMQVAGRQP